MTRLFTTALLMFALLLSSTFAQERPDRLVLGVVPFHEADGMIDDLGPIVERLSEHLALPVEAFVTTNYTGLVEAMGTGRVDIGFFGPAALVQAMDRHGARVILANVRRGETSYRAQFNVHQGSDIVGFEDLRDKVIAFVDPASTSGYHFPYVFLLREYGIDANTDMQGVFVGSHDAAVLAVYNRDVDVGVSFEDAREVLLNDYPDVMEEVRVLGHTLPIPNDGVAVRAGLSDELAQEIAEALIEITATEAGRALTEEFLRITGFAPIDSEAYDVIRETMRVFAR
ncbi:phosphate/phosphite/phosphonate ABC transporter substrate-binding protein [soil metagenome]|nr:phosphate/phosphite/phosphonate ABC transporter substrate-binding protein [Deinococcota bacterium]